MPDLSDPQDKAALSDPGGDAATATQPAASHESAPKPAARQPLAKGQRWRSYQIGEPVACETGWCFAAVDTATLEEVLIHVVPRGPATDMRAQAWQEIQAFAQTGLIKGIDAVEDPDFRFEISHRPPATTLRTWAAGMQVGLDVVQLLVGQVAHTLGALHDGGVVHLNLSPDSLYVTTGRGGPQFSIGGLERATVYNQPELIPISVDPLLAPPEAAGLARHPPGAGLRAWDWWTLGRVVQEIVLGRHVLSLLVNRDVARLSPELRAAAETLLHERDPRSPKAGAVDLMPPLDARLAALLRGLLTSSRDGRWGVDELQLWLQRQPVKNRYQLGKNEELFHWKDHRFMLPEAAEHFASQEKWDEGIENLFSDNHPATLLSFVRERPALADARNKIAELHKFLSLPNWAGLPSAATRIAVAAAAWMQLGGEGTQLILFGKRVDEACLRQLLSPAGPDCGLALLRAMTAEPYIRLVEASDPHAARVLSAHAAIVGSDTFANAARLGWYDPAADADRARLHALALEPEQRLVQTRKDLAARFARTRDAPLQQLLDQPVLNRAELVLLACVAAQPERYRFITHADWQREREAELGQQAARLATAIFWLRLRQTLLLAWPLTGPLLPATALWLAFAAATSALADAPHRTAWALALLVLLPGLRCALAWLTARAVRRHAPASPPWTWKTPLTRCHDEARAALGPDGGPALLPGLLASLAGLTAELLSLKAPLPPHVRPARLHTLRAGVAATWILLAAVLVSGRAGAWWTPAPGPTEADRQAAAAAELERAMAAVPASVQPTAEEFHFDDPRQPRVPWNIPRPAHVPPLPLALVKPATSEQVATALLAGQLLLRPYLSASIDTFIAVPVTDKSGAALMIYDGRNRRVVQRRVLVPEKFPADQTWVELDRLTVYYPGKPVPPAPLPSPSAPLADLPESEIRPGAYAPEPDRAAEKATNAEPPP